MIFVATENNTVYVFDADAQGAPLWAQNLTPSGETVQVSDDYRNMLVPQIGITGTPVIDRSTGTLYAVAAARLSLRPSCSISACMRSTLPPVANARAVQWILWRNIRERGVQDRSGNVVFDPLSHFNRAVLLLLGNRVYIALGRMKMSGSIKAG